MINKFVNFIYLLLVLTLIKITSYVTQLTMNSMIFLPQVISLQKKIYLIFVSFTFVIIIMNKLVSHKLFLSKLMRHVHDIREQHIS